MHACMLAKICYSAICENLSKGLSAKIKNPRKLPAIRTVYIMQVHMATIPWRWAIAVGNHVLQLHEHNNYYYVYDNVHGSSCTY